MNLKNVLVVHGAMQRPENSAATRGTSITAALFNRF
jgi:hypothetical protein